MVRGVRDSKALSEALVCRIAQDDGDPCGALQAISIHGEGPRRDLNSLRPDCSNGCSNGPEKGHQNLILDTTDWNTDSALRDGLTSSPDRKAAGSTPAGRTTF